MIYYKTWEKYSGGYTTRWVYEGWFLFGFIPLYIKRTTIRIH